jgi:hypothetical protein
VTLARRAAEAALLSSASVGFGARVVHVFLPTTEGITLSSIHAHNQVQVHRERFWIELLLERVVVVFTYSDRAFPCSGR